MLQDTADSRDAGAGSHTEAVDTCRHLDMKVAGAGTDSLDDS